MMGCEQQGHLAAITEAEDVHRCPNDSINQGCEGVGIVVQIVRRIVAWLWF